MGDGTIRDNFSGLIWLKNLTGLGRKNWDGAMDLAGALSSGEFGLTDGSVAGDWRLPTKEEWESFMSTVYDDPALCNTLGNQQWSEGDAFIGVQSDFYWSSTEIAGFPHLAELVDMLDGRFTCGMKGIDIYVWPVRSGN
jgi:hypothetical protein